MVSAKAEQRFPARRPVAPVAMGYTIIELLVAMVIIGILIALLMPAIQAGRESARRVQCANHLRQMGVALHAYHSTFQQYPSGIVQQNGFLWSGALLPFLEQQVVFETLDLEQGWHHPANTSALRQVYPIFRCPSASAPLRQDHGVTDRVPATYLAVGSGTQQLESGPPPTIYGAPQDGIFYLDSAVRFRDIMDGSCQTLAIGETLVDIEYQVPDATGVPQLLDHWAVGTPTFAPNEISEAVGSSGVGIGLALSRDSETCIDSMELSFSSRHPGAAQMLLADGHVRLLQQSIDATLWSAMGTKDGFEIVELE